MATGGFGPFPRGKAAEREVQSGGPGSRRPHNGGRALGPGEPEPREEGRSKALGHPLCGSPEETAMFVFFLLLSFSALSPRGR